MILADKIIALRKKNNWSQEELAEKLNVSRQAVSKWESAQSIPDITRILDMSKLLGVSVDYLIKDELEVETTASLTDETGRTTYTLTLEKAQEFLAFQRKAARAIALGVWLCVMAFMVMITAKDWPHDELMTYAFDVIVLLIISAAVALFIVFGLEFNKYKWISEEPFDTAYGVEGVVRKELKAFTPTFTSSIVTGVVLCILSCICFAAIPIVPKYADLPTAVAIGAGLTMVACGVFCSCTLALSKRVTESCFSRATTHTKRSASRSACKRSPVSTGLPCSSSSLSQGFSQGFSRINISLSGLLCCCGL